MRTARVDETATTEDLEQVAQRRIRKITFGNLEFGNAVLDQSVLVEGNIITNPFI